MISVIVPCYNVAPYLERCVNSLTAQTYSDLEIILVDDGSTDRTGEVCDRLIEYDSRIKVIHKENGGLSDARNAGIDIARGEFYSFIDGDDFIETDAYEVMMKEMDAPQVSIVAGGFIVTDIEGNTHISMSPERQCLTKEDAFLDLLGGHNYITQSSCNKLFRSNLFENIRYKKGILNEDMEILPRLLDRSNVVVLLDKVVYHYIKKPQSITMAQYSIERYKAIEIERDIYKMCKSKYPQLQPYASYYELKSLYEMWRNLIGCSNHKAFKIQELCLRARILGVAIRCTRWKNILKDYKAEMKIYCLHALMGVDNVSKLVLLKKKMVS